MEADDVQPTSVHAAKTHLSRLIERALAGEDVVIGRGRTPLVRLVPVAAVRPARQFGTYTGPWSIAEDFDAPLEDFAAYLPALSPPSLQAAEPTPASVPPASRRSRR